MTTGTTGKLSYNYTQVRSLCDNNRVVTLQLQLRLRSLYDNRVATLPENIVVLVQVLGCDDTHSMLREKEMCSGSKILTLNLTRTGVTGAGLDFLAEIKVKKHPCKLQAECCDLECCLSTSNFSY